MSVRHTIALGALVVVLLTGCGPQSDSPDPAGTQAASPTDAPTVTPVSNPTMPAFTDEQLVLVVSADATAPNGAVMTVTMKTYYPVDAKSEEAKQIQDYLAFVGATSEVADPEFTMSKKAIIQVSQLTATAKSGVWPSGSGVLPFLGPGTTDTIVDIPAGPVSGSRLSITGTGNGFGVAAIYSEDGSATDVGQWAARFTSYGFSDAFAGATLTNCSVTIAPVGTTSAGIGAFAKHNCYVGVGD